MELLIAFILFILSMAVCLWADLTMLLSLTLGFLLFTAVAVRKGFPLKSILYHAGESLKESLIVVRILLLIGCLTGLWRISGTVAYFVTLGISVIPPTVFLLAAFLLAAFMSFALGTSFGVTATAGVILMSIARAGGVNPVLAAGAVFSGVYVGDRGSPAASSGNLVAVLTHTDMRQNVRLMLNTSVLAFLLCCIAYGGLSYFYPMQNMDMAVLNQLSGAFSLQWYCLIPAVLMIALPFVGCKIPIAMLISLAASFGVTVFGQQESLWACVKAMVMGFAPEDPSLNAMLSGGGIASMVEVCFILMISGTYGGIFRSTGLLDGLTAILKKASAKIGRYPVMLAMSIFICGLFCNQTIGIIMQNQLSDGLYDETENSTKMLDIENSVVLTAGLVPWCIASSVPLAMLGVDASALPFGFYLWLVPLIYLFTGKKQNP